MVPGRVAVVHSRSRSFDAIRASSALVVVGLGSTLVVGLWVVGPGSRRLTVKLASMIAFISLLLFLNVTAARRFDESFRVIQSAYVKNGRVIHEGIGLSYAVMPNARMTLRPIINRMAANVKNPASKLSPRLREGIVAILNQIILPSNSQTAGRNQLSINVGIQYSSTWDLSQLLFTRFASKKPERRRCLGAGSRNRPTSSGLTAAISRNSIL